MRVKPEEGDERRREGNKVGQPKGVQAGGRSPPAWGVGRPEVLHSSRLVGHTTLLRESPALPAAMMPALRRRRAPLTEALGAPLGVKWEEGAGEAGAAVEHDYQPLALLRWQQLVVVRLVVGQQALRLQPPVAVGVDHR